MYGNHRVIPPLAAIGGLVAAQLGDASAAAFFISIYTMTVTIAFMVGESNLSATIRTNYIIHQVCGANSDLFGRRWFIIGGNVLMFIGFIVGGTAKNNTAMMASMAFIGFGAGNAQLAAFALPELLPNKWRHAAVVLADLWIFFAVVVGPVAGRFAIQHGDAWRWLFYGPAIAVGTSFVGLILYYFPPKHPRGLPFDQALKQLDYGGAILFIVATTLTLTGIVYTTTLPSSDPKVIGTLVAGLGLMVVFALYESFAKLKQPLTPTRVFTRGHGRELTAPFIAGFVVTMFYYAINIIYPTQIAVFFTDATTDFRYAIALTLPQNLGLVFGALLLTLFGSKIGHWRWTLTGSVTVMVVFGALLALGNPQRKNMMMAFVFLAEMGFGWAQYLSIAFIQFGTDQTELGIAGGLAGVARFAGGAVAISVYTTILSNVVTTNAIKLVPAAAEAAGLPASSAMALLEALPLGAAALAKVPGVTLKIIEAAGAAYQQAYVVGLRTTALSSLSFGIIGIIGKFTLACAILCARPTWHL
jgi:MFS family permease